ncbi:MAG: 23S rRNA (uracil(1939)-C(5))-methyltransferase RlmD [Clostridia bacterium]|nr:23S rRNA (uracil(1939)-C(5))-methyltransferase RlmD [Clostridia bacterium]
MPEEGDILRLAITGLAHDGSGVGRFDGQVVFIPGALPSEQVEIKITEQKKKLARGRLVSVTKASPDRVEPPCPHYHHCGGCQLQHLNYGAQLEFKRNTVLQAFRRLGNLPDVPKVHPVLAMDNPWHYRNKAQFHVAEIEGRLRLGYYKPGTHQLSPVKSCHLLPRPFISLVKILEDIFEGYELQPYNRDQNTGLLKHVVIKRSEATGETMVILVTNSPSLPRGRELAAAIQAKDPFVISVVQNINPKDRTILGKEFRLLAGARRIRERLGSLEFLLSPPAFFQVNTRQAEALYQKSTEYACLSGEEIVWDLYCGTGTLTLFLAQKAAKAYGIETVPEAVENARANARHNKIPNAEFFAGDVEKVLPDLTAQQNNPDVIVLDPPRQGATKKVLETVVGVGPRAIVYVSCDPATLARDLSILSQLGYQVREVQPVDMFPQTYICGNGYPVKQINLRFQDFRIQKNVILSTGCPPKYYLADRFYYIGSISF